MSNLESKETVQRRGPNRVALAFLFAFALSVGTIIFTGLQVRAPDPGRRERLEALREMRPEQPAVPVERASSTTTGDAAGAAVAPAETADATTAADSDLPVEPDAAAVQSPPAR